MSLKEDISDEFNVNPHNVIMVGSAKLGFSISPQKLWQHFNENSDIDIVIISEDLFKSFWKTLFLFNNNISRSEDDDKQFNSFKDYFFKGWIRPDKFNFNFNGKQKWFEYFQKMAIKYKLERKLRVALYINFEFFEKYHINNIENLKTGVSL